MVWTTEEERLEKALAPGLGGSAPARAPGPQARNANANQTFVRKKAPVMIAKKLNQDIVRSEW